MIFGSVWVDEALSFSLHKPRRIGYRDIIMLKYSLSFLGMMHKANVQKNIGRRSCGGVVLWYTVV